MTEQREFQVAIIGAGLGGLGMGMRLTQAGQHSFVILESSDAVGGTWRDNTYPGASCDVRSHLYWFSFDAQPDWSRVYAFQPEIQANIERLVDRLGLRRHMGLAAGPAQTDPAAAVRAVRDVLARASIRCGWPAARCAAGSTGSAPRTGRRWPPSPSRWSPARTRPR